jgi:hypothetical protein
MHWIIQGNVFSEEGWDRLIEALDRQRSSYSIHRCVPFAGTLQPEPTVTGPVVVMGTYTLVLQAKKRGWLPGAWSDPETFDYREQVKHWGKAMFNHDAVIYRFDEVPFQSEPFFIRPIHDTKDFTGQVSDWQDFGEWREDLSRLGPADVWSMSMETLVMVGPVKKIAREFRTWIVDGKVVTASQYKLGRHKTYQPLVDQRVLDFAQDQANIWGPAPCYVLDVFEDVQGQLWIGEVNTLNCAGFYAADMNKLVGAVEAYVARSIACEDCGNEIDPDCCHCGENHHGYGEGGHPFIPMGCTCGFSKGPTS